MKLCYCGAENSVKDNEKETSTVFTLLSTDSVRVWFRLLEYLSELDTDLLFIELRFEWRRKTLNMGHGSGTLVEHTHFHANGPGSESPVPTCGKRSFEW